jgi:uncharacterized HAD superfamily protein
MVKMGIGIDFDDVIFDFFKGLLKWYEKEYGKRYKREEFNDFDWGPVWGTDREETIKRVNKFLESHDLEGATPVNGALDALNQLMKTHNITIITGRPHQFKNKTEEWLIHHLKKVPEIVIAGEFHKGQAAKKSDICKERNIPILLEDAPETAIDCAKNGIKVILFDQPWNQNAQHRNIIRVRNWKEALKEIEKL